MRRLMLPALWVLLSASDARAQARPWPDPSPHEVRAVVVAPFVIAEVLDWGGADTPMVFLTGMGNSAHVYDDFAKRFRDRYHVFGISRRGYGASSRPADGYDVHTRVKDIVTAMDSLGIGSAIFVGHSVAGDELSVLGAAYPNRVRALVYLEAYEYGAPYRTYRAESPAVPEPVPVMTAADSSSAASYAGYVVRLLGVSYPEAEIRVHARFDVGGRFLGTVPRPDAQIRAALEGSDYGAISSPALAIYAPTTSVEEMFPSYPRFDSSTRALADRAFSLFDAWTGEVRERFRTEIRRGDVIEIAGANHFVFLSHPSEVERYIRSFLTAHMLF